MSTKLSVNLNKIALLRNARGRDYPNLLDYARKFMDLGVDGITVHPRQDERHTTRKDAFDLGSLLRGHDRVEYNIEGYPSEDFLDMVEAIAPTQCTLVPDSPDQLTSDHGWDVVTHQERLRKICDRLKRAGVRTSLFLDPEPALAGPAGTTGADRVELYTEEYASTFGSPENDEVLARYAEVSRAARLAGLEVNAGHDLDSTNLARFLTIGGIEEVSIGHALTIECLNEGIEVVVARYLEICSQG